MINISKYIQSNRIINTYSENIDLLKDFKEYQHFMTRLNITKGIPTDKKYFVNIVNDLEKCLKIEIDSFIQDLLKNDEKGFLKKICETKDKDIFRYLYLTHISDFYSICKRNNVSLKKEIEDKITDIFSSDDTVDFLCKTSKNDVLRKYEGTWCVNGIGYAFFYINHTEENKQKLFTALCELYKHYLSVFDINNHDTVYGLTHCVLHFSKFYTKSIYDNENDKFTASQLFLDTIPVIEKAFGSINKIKSMDSDMIAELLVVYKMLYKKDNRFTELAYNELVRRIDSKSNIIISIPNKDFGQLLKLNEHTNILFVLYCRLEILIKHTIVQYE